MKYLIIFALFACANAQFGIFSDIIDRFEDSFEKVIKGFDKPLSSFITGIQNFSRSLDEVAHCYEDQVGNNSLNIFKGDLNFKNVANAYYKAFSNKTISREGIQNLINSTQDIIQRCISSTNSGAKFGFTDLSDISIEDLMKRNGHLIPNNTDSDDGSDHNLTLGVKDDACNASNVTVPASFDWRDKGVVTSVKNQAQCGSCWTFATTASIESALVIAKKQSKTVDGSEQSILNCVKNGCSGGNSYNAFTYVKKNGLGLESALPYKAKVESCTTPNPKLNIVDFCVRSKYYYAAGFTPETLTDKDMQQSLVKFGPLYVTLNANPLNTRNYRSGILNEPNCSTAINHAVTLVGYTPDAWIIKNSWGANWGEQGYFRLARGQNMCGINTEIAWPSKV